MKFRPFYFERLFKGKYKQRNMMNEIKEEEQQQQQHRQRHQYQQCVINYHVDQVKIQNLTCKGVKKVNIGLKKKLDMLCKHKLRERGILEKENGKLVRKKESCLVHFDILNDLGISNFSLQHNDHLDIYVNNEGMASLAYKTTLNDYSLETCVNLRQHVFVKLPRSLFNHTARYITSIKINHCILAGNSFETLILMLKYMPNLHYLDFICDINTISINTIDMLSILIKQKPILLKTLNVVLYNVNSPKILRVFSKFKNLTTLKLGFDTTSSQTVILDKILNLEDIFHKFSFIKRLKLSFNHYKIGPAGTKQLALVMKNMANQLECLDISDLKMNFIDKGIADIIEGVSQMKFLKELALSQKNSKGWDRIIQNKIEIETFPWKNLSQLETLKLEFCSVWHEPRKKMMRKISCLKNLKSLSINIENNTFEDNASDLDLGLISSIIKDLSTIQDFSFSLLGEVESTELWVKFAESMQTMKQLSSLALTFKEANMEESGFLALGKSLVTMKNLENLSLTSKFNHITNDTIKLFANQLVSVHSLLKTTLKNFQIDLADFKLNEKSIWYMQSTMSKLTNLENFRLVYTTTNDQHIEKGVLNTLNFLKNKIKNIKPRLILSIFCLTKKKKLQKVVCDDVASITRNLIKNTYYVNNYSWVNITFNTIDISYS